MGPAGVAMDTAVLVLVCAAITCAHWSSEILWERVRGGGLAASPSQGTPPAVGSTMDVCETPEGIQAQPLLMTLTRWLAEETCSKTLTQQPRLPYTPTICTEPIRKQYLHRKIRCNSLIHITLQPIHDT